MNPDEHWELESEEKNELRLIDGHIQPVIRTIDLKLEENHAYR